MRLSTPGTCAYDTGRSQRNGGSSERPVSIGRRNTSRSRLGVLARLAEPGNAVRSLLAALSLAAANSGTRRLQTLKFASEIVAKYEALVRSVWYLE